MVEYEDTLGGPTAPTGAPGAEGADGRGAQPGQVFGRYRVVDEVARGGMGTVLRVWDEELRRNLALKLLEDGREQGEAPSARSDAMGSRFREEAQVTGQLDHPGVVPIHELGVDPEGRMYFTMRLVKGRTLSQVFDLLHRPPGQREGWTVTRAVGVVLKVCEAMAYAHDKGVVHRDLKPANVMVGRFGETYVMDWGLAKVLDPDAGMDVQAPVEDVALASVSIVHTDRQDDASSRTLLGDVVGTPSYMPPEQARGRVEEIDARSDVYAVGALLYHLLSGRAPYVEPGDRIPAHTVLKWVIEGPPKPLEEVAPDAHAELVAIASKAMARERDDRYASMLALAEDLQAYIEGRVVSAYGGGAVAEFKKWVGRNKGVAAGIAATVLALIGGLAGIGWVEADARAKEAEKNRQLATANSSLEVARDEARSNAARAEEKERLALANEQLARENEARARESEQRALENEQLAKESAAAAREAELEAVRQSYRANIHAAAAALEVGAAEDAWRRLEACPEELRSWEWEHLSLQVDPSLAVMGGLETPITTIAFSPDGRTIASGSGRVVGTGEQDYSVRLWDAATGAELETVGAHRDRVTELVFLAGGEALASVGFDQFLNVWGVPARRDPLLTAYSKTRLMALAPIPGTERIAATGFTGEVLVYGPDGAIEQTLLTGGPPARSLAASPDGRFLAAGLEFPWTIETVYQRVLVWDLATGELAHDLAFPNWGERVQDFRYLRGVFEVEVSPDGRFLAASSRGGVAMWELGSGELVQQFRHGSSATDIAFHPVGPWLASGHSDHTVRIWNLETGQLLETLFGHTWSVSALAYSPSGDRLASGSLDGTIRIWDGQPGSAITRFRAVGGPEFENFHLEFSPDGSRLLYRPVQRWAQAIDPDSGLPLFGTPHELHEPVPCFTPDGQRIVTFAADSVMRVYDAWTGAELEERRLAGAGEGDECDECWERHGAFSPAMPHREVGRVVRHYSLSTRFGFGGTVEVLDLETGELLLAAEGYSTVTASAFSRDGGLLFIGTVDDELHVLDAASGAPLLEVPLEHEPRQLVPFASDGGADADRVLVSFAAPLERRLAVYSLSGERLEDLRLSSAPFVVEPTADGRGVVVGSIDGAVSWVDFERGELMRLLGHDETVVRLAVSPDGLRLASVDYRGNYRIWDTVHPRERAPARRRALAQRALEARVRPLVDRLFEERVTRASVAAWLETEADLEPELRRAAIRLAENRAGSLFSELFWSVGVLETPGLDPEQYEAAAFRVEQIGALFPEAHEINVHGGARALIGLGRYREALELLGERPNDNAIAAGLAAIAHLHLGEREPALELIGRLERNAPWDGNNAGVIADWSQLFREAKALAAKLANGSDGTR